VTVERKDGTRFRYTAKIAKGHPENPMSEEEVLEKFRSNARNVISADSSEALIAALENLDTLQNVKTLIDLLRPN
jgi:2-methylcitrate dehydratase PrpD